MGGIDVIIEDPQWGDALANAAALAARCLAAAAARAPKLDGAVALLLADDDAVRDLNKRFRRQDKPTNVLSFPSGEEGPGFLGDIAIAFGVCAREAEENRTSVEGYAAHLIVHGLLHLVGYDHEDQADAEIMEALESEILDALGVYNPYAAEESSRA
jgi:probable rRNA maturation factor